MTTADPKNRADTPSLSRIAAGLTQAEALRVMAAIFGAQGLPTPQLEARFLVEAEAGSRAAAGGPGGEDRLDTAAAAALRQMVERRLMGEPVDRIIGNSEFWSRRFDLNAETLSPRPDTETIITVALAVLAGFGNRQPRILDLGTGTGAILITLLAEYQAASGIGIDAAAGALAMARHNSILNHVADRASFQQGDWSQGLAGPFDLVVSNPPYIPSGDIAGLDREVRAHDPLLALDGGADGLAAYREIAADLARITAPEGRIIFEIGAGQAEDVTAIMATHGFALETARCDLGGHVRALVFRPAA